MISPRRACLLCSPPSAEQPITTLMAIYEVLGQYGAPTYVLYLLTGYNTIVREGTQEQIDACL